MILDEQNLFSNEQAVTSSAASANIIKTGGDIGKGEPVSLLVQVSADFAGLTNLAVSIQTDDAENFSNAVTLAKTDAIPAASLKKGYRFPLNYLPSGIKKYLRLYYTVTGTGTAGKITAGITDGNQESFLT